MRTDRYCINVFFLNGCEKKKDIIHFLQEYHLELPTEILGHLLQENATTAKTEKITFCISGCIAANLKKCLRMTSTHQKGRPQFLEKLSCKTENLSFVAKFDAWLKKKSRGAH